MLLELELVVCVLLDYLEDFNYLCYESAEECFYLWADTVTYIQLVERSYFKLDYLPASTTIL
jgi:hypothetical protein